MLYNATREVSLTAGSFLFIHDSHVSDFNSITKLGTHQRLWFHSPLLSVTHHVHEVKNFPPPARVVSQHHNN